MIGLKRGTVRLVEYDLKWSSSFNREEKKIRKIFGKDALKIQHIGSTAIPGILAKPVIDIGLVVPSFKKVLGCVKELESIGYKIKNDDFRKERLFFTKGPEDKRTHYLHIGELNDYYIEDMILFRDYLRAHRAIALKYSSLKEELAKEYGDKREIYTAKKEKFIEGIVKKAKYEVS